MSSNKELDLAYNFVQYTNKNIFLTGKAGTGKTTFLHNLKKNALKRIAVVAPTGVAAINAGGVTIHSFFQMPFGPYIAQGLGASSNQESSQRHKKFNREKINLIQSLDLLVIDEISMVRADLLDGIDEVLRRYKDRTKPFGGVQLLMIGDLHQLSPVVKAEEWQILKNFYPNLYFFSSKALQQTAPVSIELKHIYRQSDAHFIDLLNCIRENKIDAETLIRLKQRHIPDFIPNDEDGYITLTTHNTTAGEINYSKLKGIESQPHTFKATINDEFPEYSYPTVTELELKVGAQVMFVKNDSSRDKLFYNGKIGKVIRINAETIYVKCPSDEAEICVSKAEWQNIKYELNAGTKEIEEKVIGTFIQYPLKLAWAITIHKSQGLTFEKAIIDASSSFAHGQVYVALSRCKSFEGMVLRTPITLNSVKTDDTVSSYTRKAEENAPGETLLTSSKIAFQKSMLFELFDFRSFKSRLFYCTKITEEHDNLLPPSVNERLNQIRTIAEKDIYQVADTFLRELQRLITEESLPEENVILQERVKKACTYFIGKIENEIQGNSQKISIETDNKAVRKSITDAMENLKKELFVKLCSLKNSTGGFNTTTYLKTKTNAEIDYSNSLKAAVPVKVSAPEEITHPELYTQIKNWRNQLAAENNIPVYIVLPTKVIAALVAALPLSLDELETVKGIGKQKIRQYGKDILGMIAAYCEKNNITTHPIKLDVKEEKVKADTKKVSLDLYKSGRTIQEIASERNLTPATIEGHLAHFISTGDVEIYDIVSKEKVKKITEFMAENRPISLSEMKTALGDTISYSEIKAVMKHLELTTAG
ncbi:helix-turn-helix domain-containing protein [Rubrolithibacter danxiaensis]|uniref:helix-turn-helix domain-containing protein n=1 Tax=Rubrolithibacter danxiaensis TaxID=3390805 RepID=UPI003BF7ECB2